MTRSTANQAGTAFLWKIIQLGTSQTINLVRMFVLARILIPEDFGMMSIGLVTVNTILNITDLGMLPALIQRSVVEKKHFHAAWTVNLFRGLLISMIIIFGAPAITALFSEPEALPIIRVMALSPLIDALTSVKIANLHRQLNFRSLAIIQLTAVVVETMISIILAFNFGVWALVSGVITGALTKLVLSYVFAPYKPKIRFNYQATIPLIHYGRWIFLSNVAAVSGSSILQVVISRQLGLASLGMYYLALRLAFLPTEISSKVVGEVAFPLFSTLKSDRDKISKAFQTIYIGVTALLLPVYALLIAFAPTLTQDILGPRWIGTAPIIRILSLVGIIGIFGDVVIPLLKGIGRPNNIVLLETVQSGLMIVGVWSLTSQFGLIGTAFAWLPAALASQILAAIFLARNFRHPFSGMGAAMLSIIFASVSGAIVGLAFSNYIAGLPGFIISMGLGGAMIGLILFILNQKLNLGLVQTLFNAFPQLILIRRIIPMFNQQS